MDIKNPFEKALGSGSYNRGCYEGFERARKIWEPLLEECKAAYLAKDAEWGEKHFNDVMSAKKSGWDDAKIFYEARIEALIEALKKAIDGSPSMPDKYNNDKMEGWLECAWEINKVLQAPKATLKGD